ncbi:hypothetical protein GCM10025865_33800 (plasmid) [Paraoerskovia sediminicola]|uniref:Uncharacterized protein n=1 Tax=Paraoerskovia sediminicola TaxID=1138587 RepID=A0ABM8G7D8_9CELL|nr:hypothetical protein GCM10025865_33360 [Paraoerskovia sediminicola]BDZ44081.1 hypothetical protein GCM10025865_33800 [Paraoerskovia sediminicola]
MSKVPKHPKKPKRVVQFDLTTSPVLGVLTLALLSGYGTPAMEPPSCVPPVAELLALE